ncbi:MAG: hypothetical protein H6R18_645 [Proteobacteria bacterium]|nr:hypothetical protein [Pseudomonadota bacterium]
MAARSPLDLLVTHATLSIMVEGSLPQSMTDQLLESPEVASQVKNVCAKVSVQLSDEIDNICSFLGISKRKFLEAAFIEAVDRANAIMETEGVHEHLEERTSARRKNKGEEA